MPLKKNDPITMVRTKVFWGLQQVKGKLIHIDAEKGAVPFHI